MQAFPFFFTRDKPAARAVVAGGKYSFVADDDRADLTVFFIATAPTCYHISHIHESLVPLVHNNPLSFVCIFIRKKLYHIRKIVAIVFLSRA